GKEKGGKRREEKKEREKSKEEETWEPRGFEINPENSDQWGTANSIHEVFIPAQFNDPDQGLWTPSPV
ncbi:MAG: VOC family protein, partial [Nocardioides sp.]